MHVDFFKPHLSERLLDGKTIVAVSKKNVTTSLETVKGGWCMCESFISGLPFKLVFENITQGALIMLQLNLEE